MSPRAGGWFKAGLQEKTHFYLQGSLVSLCGRVEINSHDATELRSKPEGLPCHVCQRRMNEKGLR